MVRPGACVIREDEAVLEDGLLRASGTEQLERTHALTTSRSEELVHMHVSLLMERHSDWGTAFKMQAIWIECGESATMLDSHHRRRDPPYAAFWNLVDVLQETCLCLRYDTDEQDEKEPWMPHLDPRGRLSRRIK